MAHGLFESATPFANCGATPIGAWCHDCGQKAGTAHRSVVELMRELTELMTHADGRIWRTVRPLMLRPAVLTNAYLSGHRVSQIPPLRLFFVVLLVLFAMGSVLNRGFMMVDIPRGELPQIEAAIDKFDTGAAPLDRWLKPHLHRAVERPEAVVEVMKEWLERFTLLMLPIAAALLSILTFGTRPRFSVYDHLVFAMHSLSFAGIVQIAVLAIGTLLPAAGTLFFVLPVHLFAHMRGVYGGGVTVTLARMTLLGLGSLFAVVLLFLGLTWVGLQFGTS